jgi:hypothetical protein
MSPVCRVTGGAADENCHRGDNSRGGPADNTRARRTRTLNPVALIEDTLMFGGTLLVPAWLEAEVESPERVLPGTFPAVPPSPLARDEEEDEAADEEEDDDEDDEDDDEDLDDDFDDDDLDDDFDDDDFDEDEDDEDEDDEDEDEDDVGED